MPYKITLFSMARRRTAGVAWVFWSLISWCGCLWDIAGVSTTSSSGASSAGQTPILHNDRTGRTFQSEYQKYDPQQWLTQCFVRFDVHKRWTNMCDSIYVIVQLTDDAIIAACDSDGRFVTLDLTNAVKLGDPVPFLDIPAYRQVKHQHTFVWNIHLY